MKTAAAILTQWRHRLRPAVIARKISCGNKTEKYRLEA